MKHILSLVFLQAMFLRKYAKILRTEFWMPLHRWSKPVLDSANTQYHQIAGEGFLTRLLVEPNYFCLLREAYYMVEQKSGWHAYHHLKYIFLSHHTTKFKAQADAKTPLRRTK